MPNKRIDLDNVDIAAWADERAALLRRVAGQAGRNLPMPPLTGKRYRRRFDGHGGEDSCHAD
jgi:hypothetical protein